MGVQKPAFAGSGSQAAAGSSHFGSQSALLSSVRSRLVCILRFRMPLQVAQAVLTQDAFQRLAE